MDTNSISMIPIKHPITPNSHHQWTLSPRIIIIAQQTVE